MTHEAQNRLTPVKVMIVDDNSEMRTLIRSLLKDVAQEFIECAGGEEAVAQFATERPDWTLIDIVMPGVDGFSATKQIKALFPTARILIMTQHDNRMLRNLASEAGATGFLGKAELTRLESIIASGGTDGGTPG
ncbi:MAG TPA: response regulator transcription factor [Verrucomicrobiae bacterium]|nr:response regulator transcription factor [Verrucomicrobiae bacterium]